MFPFQKCESVFSHADTDENETQKKLHFRSSYLQLRGAFPLVSEMSFLAKAMQPPGCHWHTLEVTDCHRHVGR